MVQRTENTGMLESFDGKVVSVELEAGLEGRKQYHVRIDPTSFEVKGISQHMHEWIPMSAKATDDQVPQGSVLDRYLQQVEIVIPQAKKESSVDTALKLLVGKSFRFQKIKLGKDYDGNKARDYIVPVKDL